MKLDYGPAFSYPFKGKCLWKRLLIGSACSLVVPLIFGYFIRAYRKILHGEYKEPPEWDDMMDIFSQGMIGIFIVLIYMFLPFLLILIGYLLTGGGYYVISSQGAISFAGILSLMIILLGFLLLFLALILLPMALAFYADSLDIMEAINLPQVAGKIFDNIENYFMALIVFSSVALAVLGIFIFIFPVSIFYLHLFFAYVFAQVYEIE
ncbi:MAG: DUF4013 domain-containing protein [Candidatus Eremiobacterota bacterium]